MRLLVLGGTGWLGYATASAALAVEHDVTCVARRGSVPVGARHVAADRDEDDALATVGAGHWDAVIDVARQPGHVRRAVRDLCDAAHHYVFVSTCSVYASQGEIGADEDALRLPPLASDVMDSMDDYGSAKVACEDAVVDGFGEERSALVRAGLIGGPGDPSGRTTYWPRRMAAPSNAEGQVLVPDAAELPTAVIDVRDLAAWLVRLAESAGSGPFNAQGSALRLPEHLAVAQRAAGTERDVVSAPEEWLVERHVAQWSGARSLPLWLADRDWYGMNARSTRRAHAAGLVCRQLEQTLADSLDGPVVAGAGLVDADERELLVELGGSRT